jgi:hypothetical protein
MNILSNEDIHDACPAAFALAPADRCSALYKFIPTMPIVDAMRERGWEVTRARQSRKASEHGAHNITFALPGTDGHRAIGHYRPSAHLINSHNCTRRLTFYAGLDVCACDNQLHVPVPGMSTAIDRIHLMGFGEVDLDALIVLLLNTHATIAGTVAAMRHLTLDAHAQREFATQAVMLKNGNASALFAAPDDIDFALRINREADAAPTLWNTLNTVQENLIQRGRHGGIHEVLRNNKLNSALWTQATAMLN